MATAEILSIGTELLLGHVLDTNCQFFAQELASLGIDCFFRSTVGDNKTRIKEALKVAIERADIIITTGGLGPTADDLTTESLAEFFNVPLDFDQEIFTKIEQFFIASGYPMPEGNRKQAMRPRGSTILPNPNGTAPGIIWQLSDDLIRQLKQSPQPSRPTQSPQPPQVKVILTFPGVPRELFAMWRQTAKLFLQNHFGADTIWSCQLKHYGIGESALAEKYAHLLNLSNPTVAPYAGYGECRLTVTAKAINTEQAKALAQPVINEILQTSGTLCYGFDDETLESALAKLLIAKNKTLSVAESCTGGLISKRLTDIAGSSAYISLNVITYSNEAKMRILSVPEQVLNTNGAVSAQCAEAMASGIRNLARTDSGLSVTGIAGPDGDIPDKPIGLVYIGLADRDQCVSIKLNIPPQLSRETIRQRAANAALNMVRLSLLKNI